MAYKRLSWPCFPDKRLYFLFPRPIKPFLKNTKVPVLSSFKLDRTFLSTVSRYFITKSDMSEICLGSSNCARYSLTSSFIVPVLIPSHSYYINNS